MDICTDAGKSFLRASQYFFISIAQQPISPSTDNPCDIFKEVSVRPMYSFHTFMPSPERDGVHP